MISIIISSYQPVFFNLLIENISETCGVEFEIIKVDNPGKMTICNAYNLGAEKAKYEYLLFCHEDILFRTKNWGKNIIHHLQQDNSGVIGVAGGNYVPSAPCGWNVDFAEYKHLHIIQNNKSGSFPKHINTFTDNTEQVICYGIDGVLLGVSKKIFDEFRFNETINGFHGYDLDFSLRVSKKYSNYVVADILIEHFSEGKTDKTWFENNLLIRKKLGSNFQKKVNPIVEEYAFINFLSLLFKYHGITLNNVFKSFQFLPLQNTNLHGYIKILKYYYYIFRYKKSYKKKYYTI